MCTLSVAVSRVLVTLPQLSVLFGPRWRADVGNRSMVAPALDHHVLLEMGDFDDILLDVDNQSGRRILRQI